MKITKNMALEILNSGVSEAEIDLIVLNDDDENVNVTLIFGVETNVGLAYYSNDFEFNKTINNYHLTAEDLIKESVNIELKKYIK